MTSYRRRSTVVSRLESLVIGYRRRRLKVVLRIGICVEVKGREARPLLYESDVVLFVSGFGM